ncbi:hypothetical protein EGN72_03085 [Pseudorhodobacter sp. E13]|uniref:hypothetical protein n=1 Tax=Pseudorhodobacter sp. E13 TaxID=2487931 RepID=UPI000F8EEB4A|nr:hypothetical protein [Pseudorhodobacter sp. E13]RUS63641.1 hypothetical protein EGN72_03085 [Pseudorhodobacter sp. E13]
MQTAAFGAYPGPSGEIFVNVRKGDQGVQLSRLLPASAQKEGFDAFPLAAYFDYVQLWLTTPMQWQEFARRTDTQGATNTRPIQTCAPGFDLSAYDLIDANNYVNYEALQNLVSVIAQLYDHKPLISPQAGLFFNLFKTGLEPSEIFDHITSKAAQGTPDSQNVVQLDQVRSSSDFQKSTRASLAQASTRLAAKQLKAQRKQGRLNRKRGRK